MKINISSKLLRAFLALAECRNFTRAAEKSNAENLVIIESGPVAEKYVRNWQKHRNHAQSYLPKSKQ